MKNNIYISSRKEQKEYIKDNFNNVYFIDNKPSRLVIHKLYKKIMKEKINEVIIEDYFITIDKFINKLNKKNISVKMVWTLGLATLSEVIELNNLLCVLELLKNNKIKTLAFCEDNIYEAYKEYENVRKIKLTVKGEKCLVNDNSSNNIAIIGNPYKWQSNYFNQLSAIKMLDKDVLLLEPKNISERFCKTFNINYIKQNIKFSIASFNNAIKNVDVMSCVEFTNLYDLYVIDSYNHGTPVLLGNNTLFFNNTKLFDKVVVSSDDDILEIANKLKYLKENKSEIINEYKKIKKDYDILSKKLIKDFIEE